MRSGVFNFAIFPCCVMVHFLGRTVDVRKDSRCEEGQSLHGPDDFICMTSWLCLGSHSLDRIVAANASHDLIMST